MPPIEKSLIYTQFDAEHPGVELWRDEECSDTSWSYFWVVSRPDKVTVRNLAYLRIRNDELQQRQYDQNGDDTWLPVN